MATRRLVYNTSPSTRSYILRQLRENDNENYISNLLQRKHVQPPHAALRVFNITLAHIRNTVSNEDLGRLRIAHFRSELEHVLNSPNPAPQTPVMEALAESVTRFPGVEFGMLHRLIDAREADLAYPNHPTLDSLERFAQETQGVLLALHAEILGAAVPEAAELAGAAVGLAISLRGVPAHAASRLSYMPHELVREAGIPQKSLLSSDGAPVFRAVGERAEALLRLADARVANLDGGVKPAFWPLRMADLYLTRLRGARWDPFDERLQRGLRTTYPLALQVRLLRMRLLG